MSEDKTEEVITGSLSGEDAATSATDLPEESVPSEAVEVEPAAAQQSDQSGSEDGTAPLDALGEILFKSIDGLERNIDHRFSQTAASLANLADQLSFLPKQIRNIAGKIDDVSTAIADSNYRSLLLGIVSIYDLAEQMLRTLSASDQGEGHRCLATVTLQLRQILESNGLVRIVTEGQFDPKRHRAIESFACETPEKNDTIKEEVRPGFLDGSKVLRFAEVTVWKYTGTPGETVNPASPSEILPETAKEHEGQR